MRHRTLTKRLPLVALVAAGTLALAACGDAKLKRLELGISRDSMLTVLAQGAPAGDSLPFIYTHNAYLVDGKVFDIYFYDAENRKRQETPGVSDKEVIPIVVVDGVVRGMGWRYADDLQKQYKIPARSDFMK